MRKNEKREKRNAREYERESKGRAARRVAFMKARARTRAISDRLADRGLTSRPATNLSRKSEVVPRSLHLSPFHVSPRFFCFSRSRSLAYWVFPVKFTVVRFTVLAGVLLVGEDTRMKRGSRAIFIKDIR